MGSLEDKDLTLAYQRGEDGAYQAIYDRYSHRVHSVCRRMLGNTQDAQDAAQESFLRVYQALGRFNGRYQLGAWITRIATNVCLDHIRAKTRRPKDVIPLEIAELDGTEDVDLDGPDEVVIRRSESRRVRKVLESLPPMHRAAIVLRDFEGLSYAEVAVALQITECQVKALIHRARQGFKRSWRSIGLSALFPAGLFQRVRKVHTPKPSGNHTSSVHQVAETLTASAAPAASSCSAALGQCGQFVADKFAPALAAMAVGAASLAIPGKDRDKAAKPEVSAPPVAAAQHVSPADESGENVHSSARPVPVPSQPAAERLAQEDSTSSTSSGRISDRADDAPAPPPSPAPQPSPSPSAAPSPAPPAATPPPEERPASVQPSEGTPHPTGFSFSFAWDGSSSGRSCQCMGPTTIKSHSVNVSETAGMVAMEHSLSGTATAAGGDAFGLQLDHHLRQSGYGGRFRLDTAEGTYSYTVSIGSVEKRRSSWGGWSYTYTGTYTLGSRPSKAEQVPELGAYTAVIDASVKEQRLVTVRVSLAESR